MKLWGLSKDIKDLLADVKAHNKKPHESVENQLVKLNTICLKLEQRIVRLEGKEK